MSHQPTSPTIKPPAFENHAQWNDVKAVCAKLRAGGFQALLAGGCVRDFLMGREPNDFDVATDATPDQIEGLFERAVTVGKAFGVIILPYAGFQIEVATFREDLEYKDGRRPEGVKFSTAKADAQRRDFTVNALFYDLETDEVIDFVDGRKDLSERLLRTVGPPNQRFDEDKLRILRAIRFSAQLDFDIDAGTLQAIKDRATDVSVVSHERIRDELFKLLKSPNRLRGLELLLSTKVIEGALPGLAASIYAKKDIWLKSFAISEIPHADLLSHLALLLWPVFQNEQEFRKLAGASLRLENQQIENLTAIFKNLPIVLQPGSARKGELAFLLTKEFAPQLLAVADTLARAGAFSCADDTRSVWNKALISARPDGTTPAQPLATGKDLLTWGLSPGPQMGEILREAFLLQLEGAFNSRAEVETWVRTKT